MRVQFRRTFWEQQLWLTPRPHVRRPATTCQGATAPPTTQARRFSIRTRTAGSRPSSTPAPSPPTPSMSPLPSSSSSPPPTVRPFSLPESSYSRAASLDSTKRSFVCPASKYRSRDQRNNVAKREQKQRRLHAESNGFEPHLSPNTRFGVCTCIGMSSECMCRPCG